MTRAATLILACVLAAAAGCSDDNSKTLGPGTDNLGIQLVNGTGFAMSVTVAGPGFTTRNVTVPASNFQPVEVPAAVGDAITVTATCSEWTTGTATAPVPQSLIDGYPDVYGQVTLADPGVSGQPVNVIFSLEWQ
ncbi:MAG TPA: hypothetical protein PLQ13_09550 [Candidatus Krumholzibacteria bacterium]|nr:hypothetical protein [Candidatus Krumholzibacteria bacterium]